MSRIGIFRTSFKGICCYSSVTHFSSSSMSPLGPNPRACLMNSSMSRALISSSIFCTCSTRADVSTGACDRLTIRSGYFGGRLVGAHNLNRMRLPKKALINCLNNNLNGVAILDGQLGALGSSCLGKTLLELGRSSAFAGVFLPAGEKASRRDESRVIGGGAVDMELLRSSPKRCERDVKG